MNSKPGKLVLLVSLLAGLGSVFSYLLCRCNRAPVKDQSPRIVASPSTLAKSIRVSTNGDSFARTASSFENDRIHAHFVDGHANVDSAMLHAIELGCSKYPPAMLEAVLDTIYFVQALSIDGAPAAGTYTARTVMLSDLRDDIPNDKLRSERYERILHHELSSIILRSHLNTIDLQAFEDLNPEGFEYGGDGVDYIRQGRANSVPSADFWTIGFVNEYATASVEEDINSICEVMLASGLSLDVIGPDDYPVLYAKIAQVQRIYCDVFATYGKKVRATDLGCRIWNASVVVE